jgi:hypothetical protein
VVRVVSVRPSLIWRAIAVAGTVSVLAATIASVEPSARAAEHSRPPTAKVVIRPVGEHGFARPGYQVTARPADRVDCTHGFPSVGAVDPNIQYCFPTADNAEVCWKSGLPNRVLCSPDLAKKRLVRMPRRGRFAATPLAGLRSRAPLQIVLFNGTNCSMAFNGTYPVRPPRTVEYACNRPHLFVWARPQTAHSGVHESSGTWTVLTGRTTGPLTLRQIKIAKFVGTYQA